MIRKALVLIDKGSITLSEMAMELDMSEADLKSRLEMMVMMGHLEAVTIAGDSHDPDLDCPGCLMASTCREDECSEGVPVVGYRLTDKGRRLARGKEE
ncbi:MAG: hypothetical protein JSW25_09735 [Thermoplasmata archaeon]|nr:MAG: hypothetical protein JSW25_09735 [Thermoplasmata archaeon]